MSWLELHPATVALTIVGFAVALERFWT